MSCSDDDEDGERCMCVCTGSQSSEKLRRCCADAEQCPVRTSQLLTLAQVYEIAAARRPGTLRRHRGDRSPVRLDDSDHRTMLQNYLGDALVWTTRQAISGKYVPVCDEHLRLLREPASYARYLAADGEDEDHPPLQRRQHDENSAEHARRVRASLQRPDEPSAAALHRRLAAQSEERRRRTQADPAVQWRRQQAWRLAALQAPQLEMDDKMVATLGRLLAQTDPAAQAAASSPEPAASAAAEAETPELERLLPAVAKTPEEANLVRALIREGRATGKPRVEAMRRRLVLAWLRHRANT